MGFIDTKWRRWEATNPQICAFYLCFFVYPRGRTGGASEIGQ
jgi:hypothetical protein